MHSNFHHFKDVDIFSNKILISKTYSIFQVINMKTFPITIFFHPLIILHNSFTMYTRWAILTYIYKLFMGRSLQQSFFIQTMLKGGHKKCKDAIHFSASICKQKTGLEEKFVMDFVSTTYFIVSHGEKPMDKKCMLGKRLNL